MGMMNFPGTATKDGTFTDELKDKDSPQYKQIAEEFCGEVRISISFNFLKKTKAFCKLFIILLYKGKLKKFFSAHRKAILVFCLFWEGSYPFL